ncbi:homeobox domain-containing protein 14 [Vairimorpha necatrix]|uniref:Homeobox domain-containing protein 14 n=1 Tax=Vairimorpha necatrix TaxID=6039 RepID=A0AAX4JD41_9MICR
MVDINKQELIVQAALGLIKIKKSGREEDLDLMRNKKTLFQNTVLKEVFKLNKYPSTQTKIDLGILLDLSIRTIQIWFQNERRNKKSESKDENNYKCEVGPVILWRIYKKAKNFIFYI